MNQASKTETFVAGKLLIDNWRWAGVPFYLRTGKRLAKRSTEIMIQFRRAPHIVFREKEIEPNRLILNIQPDEGISVSFGAKRPGTEMSIGNVTMNFCYREAFGEGTRSAYAVGALRALAEIHHVKAPKVLVAMSGGAAAGTFYLAGRFNEMYDWARLFDDSRFISWKRLGRGPVMDINFLVDQILRRQAPSLQRELADVPTKCCIAATKFPEGTLHWFEDEPLFEQLRATKAFPGIGGTVVKIGGSYYADGCLTASVEDCVEKAFKEGADTVVVIDNTSYDAIPAAVRTILL